MEMMIPLRFHFEPDPELNITKVAVIDKETGKEVAHTTLGKCYSQKECGRLAQDIAEALVNTLR